MEEKINDFESKIKEYEVEMYNYKKLQNDYQNLENKEIDLNNEITLQDVETIGKEKPHCVVFKEYGFKDDNVKLNAVKTLETFGVEDIKCL